MTRKRFICKDCGFKFEVETVEPDEARERRLRTYSVVCERCKSVNVEPR